MEFEELLKLKDFDGFGIDESLQLIGDLINNSLDMKRMDGLDHALVLCDEIRKKNLSPEKICILNYFIGNLWGNKRIVSGKNKWEWEQADLEKVIIHFRLALKEPGFHSLHKFHQCQILTNLGNIFDEVGRACEAFECWNRALKTNKSFAMALGNKGHGAATYAVDLYFNKHYVTHLLQEAYSFLNEAIKREKQLEGNSKTSFSKTLEFVKKTAPKGILGKRLSEGRVILENKTEERYRNWCLENNLFINPLNDLGQFPTVAKDDLHLPPMTTKLDEGPKYHGLFNQMKQEFVTARYLFFEGINSDDVHFSDKDVYLANTLDYPSYCLAVEKVKLAFRSFYSILDKVSFFLNDYLKIEMNVRDVNFRTIWYEKKKDKNQVRKIFSTSENIFVRVLFKVLKHIWPKRKEEKPPLRNHFQNKANRFLRGLFWLSKDLFEENFVFSDSLEPDAQELSVIRNRLEHRYLKVHEFGPIKRSNKKPDFMDDVLAYSLGRPDFIKKTERMLKLSRAAIIYLVLAVHLEERKKGKEDTGKLTMPMDIYEVDDEWKR